MLSMYKPAVGYLRRSTDRQEQSISDQRRIIDAYAAANSFKINEYYIDDAISGASAENRDAFQRLIADANSRESIFKYVLVYDIKRFGKVDNDEAGYYRYKLHRNGVEIIYVSEGFNGDDTDDLLRPVKQWQARQELKDLSKVTIRGLLSRVDGGWWAGGTPPLGYDLAYYSGSGEFICVIRFMEDGSKQMLDADGNIIRIIPQGDRPQFTKQDKSRLVLGQNERVKLVKQIFDWYLLEGIGYKSIAYKLNELGIPSPRSKQIRNGKAPKWCATSIMCILKNPVYTGDMVWNRLSFAKFHRISDKQAVSTKHFPGHGPFRNDKEDWIIHRNTHTAIISHSAFERVQKRREATARFGYANTHNVGRGAKSPYLLSGLLYCQNCGHKWSGYTSHCGRKKKDGSNQTILYYACAGYVSKGNSVCNRHVIRKEKLEKWVVQEIEKMLQEYFGMPEGFEKIRKMINDEFEESIPEIGAELDQVDARLREIKKTINNLIENLSAENKEFVDIRIKEFKREISSLESRKIELEAAGNKQMEIERLIGQAGEMAGDFSRTFQDGTIEEKRLIIRGFLKRIEIDPTKNLATGTFYLLPGMKEYSNLKEFSLV